MIDAPLALALTTGVVAAFNPCGFAMLPAYLSYFVGSNVGTKAQRTPERLLRAALVGFMVTLGFVAVFGTIGFVVTEISGEVYRVTPWITMVIGLALVVMGVAMVRGYEPSVGLPKIGRARKGDSLLTMFVYGVSYATVSLGCTLPTFLAIVASSFKQSDVASGVVLFITYALGMGLVVVALSIAVALAQQAFVRNLRKVLPFVNRVSGVLLVVAGLYVAYYGWYERHVTGGGSGDVAGGGLVDRVTGWSGTISTWVQQHLGTSVLVALLVALALLIGGALVASHRAHGPASLPSERSA